MASLCSSQIVQTVLDMCPDLSPTSIDPESGQNLLTAAAEGGDEDIVRRLIEAAEDSLTSLTCRDSHGNVILHVAAMHGHVSVVELCLELGSDPEQGRALELAAGAGHSDVVKLLVRRGAKMLSGALTMAIRNGHKEVRVILT